MVSQTTSEWTKHYFTPVASVLLFNVGDLVGRSLATLLQWPGRGRAGRYGLLAFTVIRIGDHLLCWKFENLEFFNYD